MADCWNTPERPETGEFTKRLETPGLVDGKGKGYLEDISQILSKTEGKNPPPEEVWAFLRAIHVLSLDLATGTRQAEALAKSLLAQTANGSDKRGTADSSWNELVRVASEGMPDSKSFGYGDLPAELRERHAPIGTTEHSALRALADHSSLIEERITPRIGQRCRLERGVVVQQTLDALHNNKVVIISGAAGS